MIPEIYFFAIFILFVSLKFKTRKCFVASVSYENQKLFRMEIFFETSPYERAESPLSNDFQTCQVSYGKKVETIGLKNVGATLVKNKGKIFYGDFAPPSG